jgi:hypothetical protein
MADLTSFSVVSYKCRGLNALKLNYVRTLQAKTTVLFLQEHWLTDDQLQVDINDGTWPIDM